jgi:quercetin dioxygenase-like cupin family protein
MRIKRVLPFVIAVSVLIPFFASADDEGHTHGVTSTEVYPPQPVPPDKVVRIVRLNIEPHGMVERHCHSGEEIGIVAEGTLMLRVGDGDYVAKHQGQSFNVVAKTPMTVKNDSDGSALLYSVLVVDNDQQWLKHGPENCLGK